MTRELRTKLAIAATMLAATLAAALVAAQLGVLELGAGDMSIRMGKGDDGLTMDIAYRGCPPNCGFDIDWRPLAR